MPLDPISFLSYGGSIEKLSKKASKHIKMGNPRKVKRFRFVGRQGRTTDIEAHLRFARKLESLGYYPHIKLGKNGYYADVWWWEEPKQRQSNPIRETILVIKNPASWLVGKKSKKSSKRR